MAETNGDSTVVPMSLKSRFRRFLLSDIPASTYDQIQPTNGNTSTVQPTRDLFKEISTNRRQFFNLPWQRYANPDDLVGKKGLKIYGEMQNDDAVKAALTLKKHSVLSTGWDIEPATTDAIDIETAEFIKYNFIQMQGSFDDNLLAIMSALAYGYSLSELIFQQFDSGSYSGKIGLKAIKTRLPYEFGFLTDPYDNLLDDGITQGTNRFPSSKFVLYSFNSEFGNLYGTSDLRAAYAPYWMKKNVWNWWAMFLDRYGIPLAEGMYPRNSGLSDQAVSDLQTTLDRLQAATSITHPDDIKLAFPTSSISAQGSQVFEKALQASELAIARALLLPNLLGMSAQGDTGSFAQAKKHFDVFILIVEKLQRELSENVVGEQIIRRVIDLNYRVEQYPKFIFLPFTETNKSDLLTLWFQAIAAGAVKSRPEDEQHIRLITEFPEVELDDLKAEIPPEEPATGTEQAPLPEETPSTETNTSLPKGSIRPERFHEDDPRAFGFSSDGKTLTLDEMLFHIFAMEKLKKGETIGKGPGGESGVWRDVGGNPVFIPVDPSKGESIPGQVAKAEAGGLGGASGGTDSLRIKMRGLDEEERTLRASQFAERQSLADPKNEISEKDGIAAIEMYTGNEHFKAVNEALREGKPFKDIPPPALSKQLGQLNQLASQEIKGGPVLVYRGVSSAIADQFKTLKSGEEITTKGFVSTSFSPSVASGFSKTKTQTKIVLEIKAKRGISVGGHTKYQDELELIQAHGTKYRFIGTEKNQIDRSGKIANSPGQSITIVKLEEI